MTTEWTVQLRAQTSKNLKLLGLSPDSYEVRTQNICGSIWEMLQASFNIAAEHFHEIWVDDAHQRVCARRPKTLTAWTMIAAAQGIKDLDEARWLDWARRSPMEAREILDLPPDERKSDGDDPPDDLSIATWWPEAFCADGTNLGDREYLVEVDPKWADEPFGFSSSEAAASMHFGHWEYRVDNDGFTHVIGKGPRSRTARFMCKIAEADREKSAKSDEAKMKMALRFECFGLIKKTEQGYKMTDGAQAISEMFETSGVFMPGAGVEAVQRFIENEL